MGYEEAIPAKHQDRSIMYKQEDATIPFVFSLPDGHSKTLLFTKRPVGLDFHASVPLTVKKVKERQQGHEMGVLQDWILKVIDGHELGGSTYKDDFNLYCGAIQKLPMDTTRAGPR